MGEAVLGTPLWLPLRCAKFVFTVRALHLLFHPLAYSYPVFPVSSSLISFLCLTALRIPQPFTVVAHFPASCLSHTRVLREDPPSTPHSTPAPGLSGVRWVCTQVEWPAWAPALLGGPGS